MKATFFFLFLLSISIISAAGNACYSHDDCADGEYCGAGGICVTMDRPGDTGFCCLPALVLAAVCAATVLR